MLEFFLRALLAFITLFMLANAIAFWFALDSIMPLYALATTSALGRAGIRADFGGFFFMAALLAGYAAYHRNGSAALAGAVLFFFALTGRLISWIFEGPAPDGLVPMIFEAVSGSILLLAWNRWRVG